jgi:hypothetical protein
MVVLMAAAAMAAVAMAVVAVEAAVTARLSRLECCGKGV